MNKLFLHLINCLITVQGIVSAQSVIYSATPKSNAKTILFNTLAPNLTQKKGAAFGGGFKVGAACLQAPSRVFTDSLNSFQRDSLILSTRKTANLSFGFQANSGYKLQVDSISCQLASNADSVKYRIAISVDGGHTINFIDSNFDLPKTLNCASTNIPIQSAVCNYLIQSSQAFMVYLYFFNAISPSEVNVWNVSVKGCVLPKSANKDCNGSDNAWLSPPPIDKYKLVYTEDFTSGTIPSKINTKNWVTRGYGGFGGLMKDTNVYLANNMLHVKYTQQDTNYIGGGIQSLNQFHYGYYETYMKAYIGASNFHQTFWLIGTNNNWRKDSLPVNNSQVEIDALQMDSYISNPPFASYFKANNQFAMYNHAPIPLYDDALPYVGESGSGNAAVYDTGWIKVGLEWLPDSIKLYYNDTLRQIFLTPKPWQHHAQLGVQFSGLPTPVGYSTSMTANMSCPADAEMLVDWFKFYAPNTAQSNMNFISEGDFDYDLRPKNRHRPLCWINAQSFDIMGVTAKFDTIATSMDTVHVHSGLASLKHYYTKAYKTATRQILNNIANGNYKLTAWVNCSGGQNSCQMRLLTGGTLYSQNIVSTNDKWIQLMQTVSVQNNRAVVEFYSDALANNSLNIDEVSMVRLPDNILSNKHLTINAKEFSGGIEINWQESVANGITRYEVERSTDGNHFENLGIVNISTNNTCQYKDTQLPIASIFYYRLKAVSQNGDIQYSNTAKLAIDDCKLWAIKIYPNPTKSLLNVYFRNTSEKDYTVKINSVEGKEVYVKEHLIPQNNLLTITTNNLPKGVYTIEIGNASTNWVVKKFMKN